MESALLFQANPTMYGPDDNNEVDPEEAEAAYDDYEPGGETSESLPEPVPVTASEESFPND